MSLDWVQGGQPISNIKPSSCHTIVGVHHVEFRYVFSEPHSGDDGGACGDRTEEVDAPAVCGRRRAVIAEGAWRTAGFRQGDRVTGGRFDYE